MKREGPIETIGWNTARAGRGKAPALPAFVRAAFAAGLLALIPAAALAQASPAVPVRVGGDWEFAACAQRGTINMVEARDDLVPVNSTPTPSMRPIGRLPVGTQVYMCDTNGTFVGVVWGDGDCGLDEPIERRTAYRGQCASGWVHNRSIDPADDGAV